MTDGSHDWRDWLHRHGPALVLLARQYVSSHADAEDMVQEAFVRFWRSRERANDATAYVFACVRSCALDWIRTSVRRERREVRSAATEMDSQFEIEFDRDDRRIAVEMALRSLPEPQREVLVMKIWGELTFPQIADALEISANTAASRYRYALEKLREQLAEEVAP